MISDHANGNITCLILPIFPRADFSDPCNDIAKEVRVVVTGNPLENGSNPFQPHSRIDAGLGQRGHLPILLPIKLHEDQVPELQKPVALTGNPAIGPPASNSVPLIDDNLRAGTARPRLSHGPKIVLLAQSNNPLRWDSHLSMPDVKSLFILLVDGNPELFLGKTQMMGKQIPPELNGTLFEIVPEGKIPQHLEKGMVAGRLSYIFQVVVFSPRPYTLLR